MGSEPETVTEVTDGAGGQRVTQEQRAEALARVRIFAGLSREELMGLAQKARERSVEAGEVLFLAGEQAQGMFVVLRGAVRAVRVNADGREQTIHVEEQGGMLAEVAVFDGGGYPSTAIAETDARLLFLAREDVLRFLELHPAAALEALRLMAEKLRRVSGLAERLGLQDVSQRLAAMMVEMSGCAAEALQDGDSFSLPLSHGQIASRLGTVREVVTRAMQRLTQQEVIAIHGHRVVVASAARLARLAEGDRAEASQRR